jgi:hypothetical protein
MNPELEKVQSIYILPMSGGMDQFLANRITRFGKIQIVADPLSADTILTDRIGVSFEKRLDLIYGLSDKMKAKKEAEAAEEKAAAAPPVDEKPVDDKETPREKAARERTEKAAASAKDKAAKDKEDSENEQVMRVSAFGQGNGTFFLVDRKTRSVIWSIYEKPKSTSAGELNKTAEKVVNQLRRDLKPMAVSAQN